MNHQLDGIRAAAKVLGGSAEREVGGVKKRVLSAAGRAAIAREAKKRGAKVRKQAKVSFAEKQGIRLVDKCRRIAEMPIPLSMLYLHSKPFAEVANWIRRRR